MTELPKGWAKVTLDELGVEFQPGFASGAHNRDGHGVLHLRPMNITRAGQIDIQDARFIADDSDRRLRQGDIVFNNTNSPELVGKTACYGRAEPAAFSNHMTRLRPPRGVNPNYLAMHLHWLWKSGYFKSVLSNHVNQASVSTKVLAQTSVLVAPLAEQRRIIAALEDHLSRLAIGMKGISSSLRSLQGLKRRLLDQEVASASTWQRLRDALVGIEAGKSFACEPRPASPSEWGVIKVSAMTWGEFRPEENKAVPADYPIDPRYEIKAGDILVSRANTVDYVGAPVIVRGCRSKLLLSDKSLRLKLRPEVNTEWLIHVLSSPQVRRQISERATGTKDSMRNISQSSLLEVRIPRLSVEEQARVAARIEKKFDELNHIETEITRTTRLSDTLRRALLSEAFSGRLVPQDPSDEPASLLLERSRAERAAAVPAPRRGRRPRAAATEAVPGPRRSGEIEAVPEGVQDQLEFGEFGS